MFVHHTAIFVTCVLFSVFSAGQSLAEAPSEDRVAAQLERNVDAQVSKLVAQRLAGAMAGLTVPSALPPASPARHASPVASATSARALPNGELSPARLACRSSEGSLECQLTGVHTALAAHTVR